MSLEKLLITSGIIIVLIYLAFRLRRKIKLAFIRIIYGQYSYEYLSTHKRFFVMSPFQYCFKDDFISHIIYVLSKKEDVPSFKSHKEIFFENTPYFIEYREFLKQRGKPYCFNAYYFDHLGFEIKALGYQSTVMGSKAVIVYYFMNDAFFMGEYIFKNPKTNVKAKLAEHFLDKQELLDDNFYIENTKDRVIHYRNTGFTVDIKFLNREDRAVIENLQEYYKYITGKKLNREL